MAYLGKKTAILSFVIIIMMTAGLMLYSLDWVKQKQIQLSQQKLLQEAIAHFDNMVVTRSWSAMYGGVYVKPNGNISPNPYLKDNTLLDAQGNTLIRINPAWMTRQISELSNQRSRYFYKITSLNPINPHNVADAFETEALRYFEAHREQKYYYRFNDDNKNFDFMGALKVEPECLSCHKYQGYTLGDIRGGIRVSIPTDLFQQEMQALARWTQQGQIAIVLGALLVLSSFCYFLTRLYRHQQNIEQLNKSLEAKVQERTQGLEKMYLHEKYVKDLLDTVAKVNDLLLNAVSSEHILQNCVAVLAKHDNYQHCWVGLTENKQLKVLHQAGVVSFKNTVHFLCCKTKNQPIAVAAQATLHNHTVIERYDTLLQEQPYSPTNHTHWLLAIPLQGTDAKQAFGVLVVHSSRMEGFEAEEVNVLERLAMDISLVLHAHQQRAVLEKMETSRISNYEETILAFVNIIEQRDNYTAGHTIRVAQYCKKIALALGVQEADIKKLEKAAILHDIGKVATPDAVLLKPGKLTAIEYELIKQHAYAGYSMLSKIDMYKDLAEIIRYHHARYDGKGYPETGHPDFIPFLSHIMAVADAFDAMTSNRIYKPRKTVADALLEIQQYSGTQFHPKVVDVAVKVLVDTMVLHTSQTPSNELEEKRFSYFFCDSLTELYNEGYLKMMLTHTEHKQVSLVLCLLKDFSQYNKLYGWDAGNKLLIDFARQLRLNFPQATVFRYHGDDFVLLFQAPDSYQDYDFDNMPLLKNNGICASIKQFELPEGEYQLPF